MGVESSDRGFPNRPVSKPEWYYALDGERKGPVSGEDFERLVEAGVVTPSTRVWCEGMAAWQPLAQVRPVVPAAPPVAPVTPPPVMPNPDRCGLCGVEVTAEDSVRLDGRLVCARCKPRAVQMLREGVQAASGPAEETRRAYLHHEASIRSVGLVNLVGAGILTLFILFGVVSMVAVFFVAGTRVANMASVVSLGFTAIYVALAALMFWLGRGLRRLNPSVRIPSAVMAGIGLIGFPIGTLINAYILWLLLSAKGRMVFSEEYRRVVAETPHIRYRTAWWVWLLLALLVAGFVAFLTIGLWFRPQG